VHVRRALLLFAIVLGVAALAASISVEPRERRADPPPTTTPTGPSQARPGTTPVTPATTDLTVAFPPRKRGRVPRRKLEVGRAATVVVAVAESGQVDIPTLGLTDAAEPDSPATFQVLLDRPGRAPILYTPAAGTETRRVGTLSGVETRGD
jgi:hypothetical protein